MEYQYITNIQHFMSEDHLAELPDDVFRMQQFLGQIVAVATAGDDAELVSGLSCRKRIARKPCPGYLMIKRQDVPERLVFWHCDTCENGGRISDWAGTHYDLGTRVASTPEADEGLVEASITKEEYKAIISPGVHAYDPDSERILFTARGGKRGVTLRAWDGDMENLLGFMASDSNHEENRKRQKLVDSAYGKIQDAYEEVMTEKEQDE